MKSFLLIIVGILTPLAFGDVVTGPNPFESDIGISSLDIGLGTGRRCETTDVQVELTLKSIVRDYSQNAQGSVAECRFGFRGGETGVNRVDMDALNECLRNKRFRFNNVENLPFFNIKSTNGRKFCLEHIKFTTRSPNQIEYKREFRSQKITSDTTNGGALPWMPMFDKTHSSSLIEQLNRIDCPENIGAEACPQQNIRFTTAAPERMMYCDFNFKCNSVSSNDPRDANSGYICYETRRGQYTNYNMCCDLGQRGGLDAC